MKGGGGRGGVGMGEIKFYHRRGERGRGGWDETIYSHGGVRGEEMCGGGGEGRHQVNRE